MRSSSQKPGTELSAQRSRRAAPLTMRCEAAVSVRDAIGNDVRRVAVHDVIRRPEDTPVARRAKRSWRLPTCELPAIAPSASATERIASGAPLERRSASWPSTRRSERSSRRSTTRGLAITGRHSRTAEPRKRVDTDDCEAGLPELSGSARSALRAGPGARELRKDRCEQAEDFAAPLDAIGRADQRSMRSSIGTNAAAFRGSGCGAQGELAFEVGEHRREGA